MRKGGFLATGIFTFLLSIRAWGISPEVITNQFFWMGSSLQKTHMASISPTPEQNQPPGALGQWSYRNYFDTHGGQPPYPFLTPLQPCDPMVATIEGNHISFRENRAPLKRPDLQPGAMVAKPYLLSSPEDGAVIAVQPYYMFLDKEPINHSTIYSAKGTLLMEIPSLPTHVCVGSPHLLVSPERSCCCESVKWTFHFYNLHSKTYFALGCPEGQCGDFLFQRIDQKGPFLLAYETIHKVADVGLAIQTDFHILGEDFKPIASGKTIFVVKGSTASTLVAADLNLYTISNLTEISPLRKSEDWVLSFQRGGQKKSLRLAAGVDNRMRVPLFLVTKDFSTSRSDKAVWYKGTILGKLPLLLLVEPGEYQFTFGKEGKKEAQPLKGSVHADQLNILTFE